MKAPGMAPLRKLNDISLFVKDLEETVRFQAEKLGFVLKRRQASYVEFDFDGTGATLWEGEALLLLSRKAI